MGISVIGFRVLGLLGFRGMEGATLRGCQSSRILLGSR